MTLGQSIKANSTHILTGAAVLGVIATVIYAVKVTPRVYTDIVAHEEYEGRDLPEGEYYTASWKERIALGWKPYLPVALLGGCTIACIVAVNTIGTRRNAALAAGAAVISQAYQTYRKEVIDEIGVDKEETIRANIAEAEVLKNQPSHEVLIQEHGKVLCYDTFSSRYFYSTKQEIENARNKVNLTVINDMYAPQNDFYAELGLARTSMGDEYGWNTDTSMNIYFTSVLTPEDQPVLAIDYHNLPITNYNKFW